jgi:hypothetical protein
MNRPGIEDRGSGAVELRTVACTSDIRGKRGVAGSSCGVVVKPLLNIMK